MAQPSAMSADPRSATGRSSTWNPKFCDANGVITLNNTARHYNRHIDWQVRMKILKTR
jgi:hypothetical protein